MKPNSLFLSIIVLFISTGLFGQTTQPIKVVPVVNKQGTVPTIKIADTTSIKIKKLQEDNQKQQQDIVSLKLVVTGLNKTLTDLQATVADIKTQTNQDHVELGITKLSLKNITALQLPVAYAAFNPENNGGYSYKMVTQYGISGGPVQVYSSVTITLNHSFEATPVIITSVSEDHITPNSTKPIGVVTYEFLPPNKIRLTQRGVGVNDVIAPFSVVVYGK